MQIPLWRQKRVNQNIVLQDGRVKWNIQFKLDQIVNALNLSKFNGECWQQKKSSLQNNVNITFLIFIRLFQKKEKAEFWKLIKLKYKNQNWTLIQKSNEKENEKTGTNYYTSPFAISFLFIGKTG